MSELTFCKTFLTALDARPAKLSSDHIADARQYPDGAVFVLPKLPTPPHPARPNPKAASQDASSSSTLSVTLKPMKPTHPTVPVPSVTASSTSIFDLKTAYATQTSIPAAKIKILYKKKPVTDSKTVAEVVGSDAGSEVEFGVMVLGGAVATPVQSPPAVAPVEEEKGLASGSVAAAAENAGPAAQGPSGEELASMAGVQVMPAVGAVDVGLGRRRVAAASRSGAGLFVGDSRRRARRPAACSVRLRQCRGRRGGLAIVCNLGGVYEDDFSDVDVQLMNYFTYRAVRMVMTQLYEMNPPNYRWFYNFVAVNKPTDSKHFLRALVKERQELAERVMITRLHLYGKWIKKCDHAKMYEKISDQNLELMRERLIETVIWPSDDTNTEKIG